MSEKYWQHYLSSMCLDEDTKRMLKENEPYTTKKLSTKGRQFFRSAPNKFSDLWSENLFLVYSHH